MANPWQIIGWWFIEGIVATPVALAVWWLADTIKAGLEEIERIDREQRERIERLEIIRAELTERRGDILLRYIKQEEAKQAAAKYRYVPTICDPMQMYNTQEEADAAAIFHYNAGGVRFGRN